MTTPKMSLRDQANALMKQADQGRETAAVAAQGIGITQKGFDSLGVKALADRDLGKHLKELERARKQAERDPLTWRAYTAERLRVAAEDPQASDPRDVIWIIRAAIGRWMPGKRDEVAAYPLFVSVQGNHNKYPLRFYMPQVRRDENSGELMLVGVSAFRPAADEDAQSMRNLFKARENALETLVVDLEADIVCNLRHKVETILVLARNASLYTGEAFRKSFEEVESGLFKKSSGKPDARFRMFEIGPNEVLVLPDSTLTERMIKALVRLKGNVDNYWADDLNIDEAITNTLDANRDRLLTKDQFLRNVGGMLAVCHHSWKLKGSGQETEITMLLERRDDGKWKVTLVSVDGAKDLFGGPQFRFHDWNDDDLPPHIEAFIRNGDQVSLNEQSS